MPIVLLDERDKAELQEQIDDLVCETQEQIDDLVCETSRNSKRLTNLEHGIPPEQFVIDSSVAYSKDVPENVLPYAEISKVGGMTRKCTNLCDEQWEIGCFRYGDNSTYVNDSLRTPNYIKIKPSTTYYTNTVIVISYYDENKTFIQGSGSEFGIYTEVGAFTTPSDVSYMRFYAFGYGTTYKNDIMISEGAALPYEPYFEDLRSAQVTEIESVGVNLFDKSKVINVTETETGFSFTWTGTDRAPISIGKLGDVAPQLKVGDVVTFYTDVVNGSYGDAGFLHIRGSGTSWTEGKFVTITEADLNDVLYAYGTPNEVCEYNNLIITKIENTPYTPYTKYTFPIPEAVQALEGYGWGINESVYNYIDFEKKQFVKRVEKVVLDGSESFSLVNNRFSASILTNHAMPHTTECICNKYPYEVSVYYDSATKTGIVAEGTYIRIRDMTYTSVDSFKAYLAEQYANGTPVTIVYVLVQPIITDVSDILSADNYIGVEGGGTITSINEYGYAVPSEIIYQKE